MRVDPLQVLTKLAAAQNIPTRRVTPPFDGLEEFDYGLRRSLDPQFDWQEFGRLLLEQTPAQTLLFVEGTFELHFALFRIPDEENTVFLVGPWTFGPRSEKARKWARRYLGEAGENAVQEYYNGVKLLQANDFYMTIRVLVGMMMGGGPGREGAEGVSALLLPPGRPIFQRAEVPEGYPHLHAGTAVRIRKPHP